MFRRLGGKGTPTAAGAWVGRIVARGAALPHPGDPRDGATRPAGLIDEQPDHRLELGQVKPGRLHTGGIARLSVLGSHDPRRLDHALPFVHDDVERSFRLSFLPRELERRAPGPTCPLDFDGAIASILSVADRAPDQLRQLGNTLLVLLLPGGFFLVASASGVLLLLLRLACRLHRPPGPTGKVAHN